MKIGVCVKQVPDTETRIKIKPDEKAIDKEGINWVMNPYDEFGLEEALKIVEAQGGEVVLYAFGPKKAEEALRTGLAMGAERAVLIDSTGHEAADAFATAKILAAAIKQDPVDLVFLGYKAIDDNVSTVGPALAEYLGWPQATSVVKVELAADKSKATVERMIEGGVERLELALPCVLTAEKGLNTPRYPALSGIMKAKKKEIKALDVAALGVAGVEPKVTVRDLTLPPAKSGGKVFPAENGAVGELVKLLREEAKLI